MWVRTFLYPVTQQGSQISKMETSDSNVSTTLSPRWGHRGPETSKLNNLVMASWRPEARSFHALATAFSTIWFFQQSTLNGYTPQGPGLHWAGCSVSLSPLREARVDLTQKWKRQNQGKSWGSVRWNSVVTQWWAQSQTRGVLFSAAPSMASSPRSPMASPVGLRLMTEWLLAQVDGIPKPAPTSSQELIFIVAKGMIGFKNEVHIFL